MDNLSQERLDSILLKEEEALNEAEKGFLRARRDYLTDEQKAKYPKTLDGAPEGSNVDPAEAEAIAVKAEEKLEKVEGQLAELESREKPSAPAKLRGLETQIAKKKELIEAMKKDVEVARKLADESKN